MISVYNIVFVLAKLFNLYIINRYMNIFFDSKKVKNISVLLIYIIYFLFSCTAYFVLDIPFVNLLINSFSIIAISLFYGNGFKKQVWCGLFIFVISVFVEIGITAFIISPHLNWFSNYNCSNIFGVFLNQIVQLLMVLIMENVIHFKSKGEVPVLFLVTSLTVPSVSIALLMAVTGIDNVNQGNVAMVITIVFFINALVFIIYDSFSRLYERNLSSAILEQERQLYYNQCVLMQETSEEVRDFKHDINNHLMMITELINKSQFDKAKKYILGLSTQTKILQNTYSCTGNIVVDSILNYKLNSFQNKNIQFEVETNIPTDIPIEMMDLSAILTNLIDNAIQALEKTDDKKLFINMNYHKGILCIIIKNSYNGVINYENGEIVTTKKESCHGRGIKIINKIADKYDGLLNLTHDKEFFTAELLIYCCKS